MWIFAPATNEAGTGGCVDAENEVPVTLHLYDATGSEVMFKMNGVKNQQIVHQIEGTCATSEHRAVVAATTAASLLFSKKVYLYRKSVNNTLTMFKTTS